MTDGSNEAHRLSPFGGLALPILTEPGSPTYFFDDMTNWHLVYWARNLDVAKAAIAELLEQPPGDISDGSSRDAFDQLTPELRRIGRIEVRVQLRSTRDQH